MFSNTFFFPFFFFFPVDKNWIIFFWIFRVFFCRILGTKERLGFKRHYIFLFYLFFSVLAPELFLIKEPAVVLASWFFFQKLGRLSGLHADGNFCTSSVFTLCAAGSVPCPQQEAVCWVGATCVWTVRGPQGYVWRWVCGALFRPLNQARLDSCVWSSGSSLF